MSHPLPLSSPFWSLSEDKLDVHSFSVRAIEDFWVEERKLLKFLDKRCQKLQQTFARSDKSVAKAQWMLAYNSMDLINTALFSITSGRYSAVGYVARNVTESNDLIKLFSNDKSGKNLKEWYAGEFISNKNYRQTLSKEDKKRQIAIHRTLSLFSHSQYDAIMYQFFIGENDTIWHTSEFRLGHTMTRNMFTRASFPWLLASITKDTMYTMSDCGVFTDANFKKQVENMRANSPASFVIS